MSEEKKNKMKNMRKSFSTRYVKVGGYSAAASAVVIVIAIVLNLIVGAMPERITKLDVSANKIYSLSKQTKQIVSDLDKDVEIYYYTSSDSTIKYVETLISKITALNSRVKSETVDSDVEPTFCEQFTSDTVRPGSVIVKCGDKIKIITSEDLITYEAGSYQNYIYYLQQYGYNTNVYFNGELSLINAIDYVTSDKTYKVCFINYNDSDCSLLKNALEQENIETNEVDPAEKDIASDINCAVLSVSTSDISDDVYNKLAEFINGGGKIYVEVDSSLTDTGNTERLLSLLGVKLSDSVIHETQSSRTFSKGDTYLCPIFDEEHPIVYPFGGLDMYSCIQDSKAVINDSKDNITFSPLLKTSSKAYTSSEDEKSELYPAAAVQNSATGSDAVIFGTNKLMDSTLTSQFSLNIDLFKNSISWLCDKENSISVHAKALSTESKLTFGSDSFNTAFRVIMTVIVPAAIIICGVAVWYKRRSR